jgi:4-amino-4-deoxy-L-arabinose transferase-like glycosyltransferase
MDDLDPPRGAEWPGQHRADGSTPAAATRRGLLHHLGDGLVEVLVAVVACGLGFAALAGLRWGWTRHPASTTVFLVVLALVVIYGIVTLVRSRGRHSRVGPLAAAAGILVVALGVWLTYLATSCSCLIGGS